MKGESMRLDENLRTDTSPHRKHVIGRETFYFTRMPEGDWFIHKTGNGQGYGGSWVRFLMEDGSFEDVHGPYQHAGAYDHGTHKRLADSLNEPELARKVTRLVVGPTLKTNCFVALSEDDAVLVETQFQLGDFRERLRPEWSNLRVEINQRGGASLRLVKDMLKTDAVIE